MTLEDQYRDSIVTINFIIFSYRRNILHMYLHILKSSVLRSLYLLQNLNHIFVF